MVSRAGSSQAPSGPASSHRPVSGQLLAARLQLWLHPPRASLPVCSGKCTVWTTVYPSTVTGRPLGTAAQGPAPHLCRPGAQPSAPSLLSPLVSHEGLGASPSIPMVVSGPRTPSPEDTHLCGRPWCLYPRAETGQQHRGPPVSRNLHRGPYAGTACAESAAKEQLEDTEASLLGCRRGPTPFSHPRWRRETGQC